VSSSLHPLRPLPLSRTRLLLVFSPSSLLSLTLPHSPPTLAGRETNCAGRDHAAPFRLLPGCGRGSDHVSGRAETTEAGRIAAARCFSPGLGDGLVKLRGEFVRVKRRRQQLAPRMESGRTLWLLGCYRACRRCASFISDTSQRLRFTLLCARNRAEDRGQERVCSDVIVLVSEAVRHGRDAQIAG